VFEGTANRVGVLLILAVLVAGLAYFFYRDSEAHPMNTPRKEVSPNCEFATLGGGCFWCIEAVYENVKGVERVESGYAGGTTKNPTYRQVCGGDTGHAEVIQIAYDPKVVSFKEVLEIFFVIHDPTQLNRQGNDAGTQYRSAVFHHSPEQKKIAEDMIAELTEAKAWARPIVTTLEPMETFYRAEDYHQSYFQRNPGDGYCRLTVPPKMAKMRKNFASKLKPS
jgi:peptide-methionine (S)-S-oxide reductase